MKPLLFVFCFSAVRLLFAQIQIDIVEEAVEAVPDRVEAPAATDHSNPRTSGPATDLLYFLNEDRISGELQRIDAEEGLVWKHPDALSETVYGLDNLKKIELRDGGGNYEEVLQLPRIELTNGDQYRGRILGLDAESLTVESPLGGTLQFRTDMIYSIRPVAVSTSVYSGPNGPGEWDQNNSPDNGWEFKNNAMYSTKHNQVAGQKFDNLPDKVSLEFTMEWRGNPSLQVGFWGQDTKNVNQNCYTLAIQNSYLRCYRNYNKIGRNDLGNAQARNEMQGGAMDVRLLLNREAKEVMVLLNGKLVGRFKDAFDGKIEGNAIIFGGMGNTPVKVSRIVIREWDGDFSEGNEEKPREMDQLVTLNGDVLAGSVIKIEADTLHFKGDFATFEVPVDRIAEITFSRPTRAEPRLQAGDVEITFPSKERVTLKLLKLDGRELLGTSEATGEVALLKKYFSEIRMNPYDNRHQVEEDAW